MGGGIWLIAASVSANMGGMARKKRARPPSPPKQHYASIWPRRPTAGSPIDGEPIPLELVSIVRRIERHTGMPVWMLVQAKSTQRREDSVYILGEKISRSFFAARYDSLRPNEPIILLIDSPGGWARSTYALAMLLRRHCGGFIALIPRRAKSAATLLALGADKIILNKHAELGPLDVQIYDPEREDEVSGLDEVQSLERLHAFSMSAFDKMMLMLIERTGKKTSTLAPIVGHFVASLTKPLFEGVDVVRFTQMSRLLKVAEEYGKRLLEEAGYSEKEAAAIANKLVENYPEHGFPVYGREAVGKIGLNIAEPSKELGGLLEEAARLLPGQLIIGRIDQGT